MPRTSEGIGWKGSDTSAQAAVSQHGKASNNRQIVHQAFKDKGPATADEIAEHLGWNPLQVRPRVTELAERRRLRDTGGRRMSSLNRPQIVWAVQEAE